LAEHEAQPVHVVEQQRQEQGRPEHPQEDVAVHLVHLVVDARPVHEGHVDDVEQQEEEHEESGDAVEDERPLAPLAAVDRGGRPHRSLRYQRSPHIVDDTTYAAKNVTSSVIAPRATEKMICAAVTSWTL